MNEVKLNSQICTTKEQSHRLLDFGLKPETADMHYSYKPKHLADTTPEKDWVLEVEIPVGTDVPAWSLHRLIELYSDVEDTSSLCIKNISYKLLIFCIEKAIHCGFFNREYLKQ